MSSEQGKQAQKDITSWASKDGQFKRLPSKFRNHIEKNGEHPPEKGRYTLYVSLACPWAHRTLIGRKLKGLESFIDVSVVHPFMGAQGWGWPEGETGETDRVEGVIPDPLYKSKFIRELYFKADPEYDGRFTVPVVWDNKKETIVNNESSEILRMFNTEFNDELPEKFAKVDLYPDNLKKEIDEQNEWVYDTVNNGVYKSGFATSQQAYESNVVSLFESLDRLEKILDGKDYVIGDQLTEADVRLYTTIVRFDNVYVGHFKCNLGTIRANYPNLHKWLRQLYWSNEAFKSTTNFEHIKHHYYRSHPQINPTRIIPVGPTPDIEKL